jgi:hypothetical protein
MKIVANIKKIEEECAKLCEESVQIWTDLVEDPNLKVIEAKLREAQEREQQASERTTTLPPAEHRTTILAQKQSYLEVEKMRDQHKILQQHLGLMQE